MIPFKDVPEGATFRFEKSNPEARYIKYGERGYHEEGGGFAFTCKDDDRPSLLLGPLTDYRKGWFSIDDGETWVEGYTTGQRWNGWAMPLFSWDVAIDLCHYFGQIPSDNDSGFYPDLEEFVIMVDHRHLMCETDELSDYLWLEEGWFKESVNETLYDIGSGSYTWIEKGIHTKDDGSFEDEEA